MNETVNLDTLEAEIPELQKSYEEMAKTDIETIPKEFLELWYRGLALKKQEINYKQGLLKQLKEKVNAVVNP